MKKLLSLLLCLVLLTGCAAPAAPEVSESVPEVSETMPATTEAVPEPVTFTDDLGRTVTVEDAKGNEMTCRIVGSQEAAPMHRVFSEESPFGRALIGAQEGDEVTVEAPMGNLIYRVKKIDH